MLHLVLDTNILLQGLWTKNMYQLTNLIDAGFVTLYVPKFVEREYKTRILNNVVEKVEINKNNYRSINKEFLRLKRNRAAKPRSAKTDGSNHLEQLISGNSSLIAGMQKVISTDYEDWKSINKVQILEFDAKQFESVENDYFLGSGVFKQAKSRNDIPDAIIYECIKSLTRRVGNVSFILKDGNFYNKAKNELIDVFKDLPDFYEESHVKAISKKLKIGEELESKILKLVSRDFESAVEMYCRESEDINRIYLEVEDVTEGLHQWFIDGIEMHFVHDLNREKLIEFSFNSNPIVLSDKYIIDVDFTCEAKIRETMDGKYMDDYISQYDIISSSRGLYEVERISLVRFQTELSIPIDALDIDSFNPKKDDDFIFSAGCRPPSPTLELGEGITIHAKRCQIIEEFKL